MRAKSCVAGGLCRLILIIPFLMMALDAFCLSPKSYIAPKGDEPDTSIVIPKLTGKVTDSSGMPLPGVTVMVKGTKKGASTDGNGMFTLKDVRQGSILQMSSVGYNRKEIHVTGDVINAQLKQFAKGLDAVAVLSTGYQKIPRERATGSFAQPDKQMFEARVSTDVLSRLEGITSGVVFNSSGITARDESPISIRGRSTIFVNDKPLVIVDNFPYDGDISNINPNDVESIDILKDAAAASIWGVRAGNGVIVITTKHGKFMQPLTVSFNSNITVSDKPDLFYDQNYMQSKDYIDLEKYLFSRGYFDGLLNNPGYPAVTPVVSILNDLKNGAISQSDANAKIASLSKIDVRNDWKKYFYRKAVNQQYYLNMRGGDSRDAYLVGLGYDNNAYSAIGNSYKRISLNGSNTFNPIKKLFLTTELYLIQTNNESDNTIISSINGGALVYPYEQLANTNGAAMPIVYGHSAEYVDDAAKHKFLDWSYKPLDELRNAYNRNYSKSRDVTFSSAIKYDVFKGISLNANYQYEYLNTQGNTLNSLESYNARNMINTYSIVDGSGNVTGYNVPKGGIYRTQNSNLYSNNFRATINYDGTIGKGYLAAIAGYEVRELKTDNLGSVLYGYDPNTTVSRPVNNTSYFFLNPSGYGNIPYGKFVGGTTNRFRSYLGNAAYTIFDKYTISLSGRIDQSNYFGVNANQRSVPLWSMGMKWDIFKERFFGSFTHVVSMLRMRATYGYNGNLDKSLTAITTFKYNTYPASLTNLPDAVIKSFGNPDLKWERIGMFNLGVDLGLFHDRITGTFEYYKKKGVDMIGYTLLAPTAGITSFKGNYSGILTHGVDISINTLNVDRAFKWRSTFLLSYAKDKVSKYTGQVYPTGLIGANQSIYPREGYPVYGVYSLKWAGLDPENGDPRGYDATGKISRDYATLVNPASFDGVIYNGPARPTLFGGFQNNFSYKGFALGVNLIYRMGYYVMRRGISYSSGSNYIQMNNEYSNRWKKPGDEKVTNVPSLSYPADPNRDLFYNSADIMVVKGDNIRLQDVTFSYSFKKELIKRIGLRTTTVYFNISELGYVWRANRSLDPDYPRGGIPRTRSISFGLKGNF